MDDFDTELKKIMDGKKPDAVSGERQAEERRSEEQALKDAAERMLKGTVYFELEALAKKLHLSNVPHVKTPEMGVHRSAWETGLEIGRYTITFTRHWYGNPAIFCLERPSLTEESEVEYSEGQRQQVKDHIEKWALMAVREE